MLRYLQNESVPTLEETGSNDKIRLINFDNISVDELSDKAKESDEFRGYSAGIFLKRSDVKTKACIFLTLDEIISLGDKIMNYINNINNSPININKKTNIG